MWDTNIADAIVDQDANLTFASSGKVTITASLEDRPEITATVTTTLDYEPSVSTSIENNKNLVGLFPNPAVDVIYISNINNANVDIYNVAGKLVKTISNYNSNEAINISELAKGVYFIKINNTQSLKFVKR